MGSDCRSGFRQDPEHQVRAVAGPGIGLFVQSTGTNFVHQPLFRNFIRDSFEKLRFRSKVDLRDVSPEDDFESIRLLLRIFQQGLRVRKLIRSIRIKIHFDHVLAICGGKGSRIVRERSSQSTSGRISQSQ
jgi:hypothetical protein